MSELTLLLKKLKSWNLHTRTNAARKLKAFRDPRITPALCKALFDFPFRHWSKRTIQYLYVIWALLRNQNPPAMYVWEKTVASYRKAIIEALIAQSDPCAIKSLKKLLSEGYHDDRKQLLAALAQFDGEEVWQILCDALIGKYGFINDTAAELLYERDKMLAVKPLINAFAYSHLGDEWKPSVDESKLIGILTKIGEPAFDDLINALNYPHIHIRNGAAKTLKELGDKRAVDALWKAKDTTPYASVAIAHLDYERAVDNLIEKLESITTHYYVYMGEMIDILGEHREERAVGVLISHIERWDEVFGYPVFFKNIETALEKIGSPKALAAVESFHISIDNHKKESEELAKISAEKFRTYLQMLETKPSWFKRILNKLILLHRNR